jgi:hypothetical protein
MMKFIAIGTTALLALATPALANECPSLIKTAQAEVTAMPNMDAALTKKVNEHIAQAQAQHDAGQHDDAIKTAKDALQLLKM